MLSKKITFSLNCGINENSFRDVVLCRCHEQLMEAAESLKKFQASSVIQANWLPSEHRAEVRLEEFISPESNQSGILPTPLIFMN